MNFRWFDICIYVFTRCSIFLDLCSCRTRFHCEGNRVSMPMMVQVPGEDRGGLWAWTPRARREDWTPMWEAWDHCSGITQYPRAWGHGDARGQTRRRITSFSCSCLRSPMLKLNLQKMSEYVLCRYKKVLPHGTLGLKSWIFLSNQIFSFHN